MIDANPLGLLVDVADHFLVTHLRLKLHTLAAVHTFNLATGVHQAGDGSADLLDLLWFRVLGRRLLLRRCSFSHVVFIGRY